MKRDARAAIELARLLSKTEAIAVLRPWAESDAGVEIEQSKLDADREEKVRILRPLAERDARAAMALARLLPVSEAIAVLRPWA